MSSTAFPQTHPWDQQAWRKASDRARKLIHNHLFLLQNLMVA